MPHDDCGGTSGCGGVVAVAQRPKTLLNNFTSSASLGTAAAPTPSATGTARYAPRSEDGNEVAPPAPPSGLVRSR